MSEDISLDTPGAARLPVVKRTAIGEVFRGVLVLKEQRPIQRTNPTTQQLESVPHGTDPRPDANGKPTKFRQELVLTFLTLPGTTSPAGIRDKVAVPDEGEMVRAILRGKAFGQHIEQTNAIGGTRVGDIVEMVVNSGQVYDASGKPEGKVLTTQAELDAVPRTKTLGIYSTYEHRRPTEDEQVWKARAVAAHNEAKAISLDTVDGADDPAFF